jgi:hypothetical protein
MPAFLACWAVVCSRVSPARAKNGQRHQNLQQRHPFLFIHGAPPFADVAIAPLSSTRSQTSERSFSRRKLM